MHKIRKCCICGKPFRKGEWGNNPEPVKPYSSGTCCDECNLGNECSISPIFQTKDCSIGCRRHGNDNRVDVNDQGRKPYERKQAVEHQWNEQESDGCCHIDNVIAQHCLEGKVR